MKFKFQKHEEYYDLLGFPYFDSNISCKEGLYYFQLYKDYKGNIKKYNYSPKC